ncbi:MAG TPA: DUF6491 family protein [Sphingomicrobium sp.]|nr:DUF6491 family protein [Sphingomicrobium sp.]
MNYSTMRLTAALVALAAMPTAASADSIPFVSMNGIANWTAVGDDTVYLQARNDQWYRADLAGPCFGLPTAFAIGVRTFGDDTFDDSSSIIVDGQRCPVMSVTMVQGPPVAARRKNAGK